MAINITITKRTRADHAGESRDGGGVLPQPARKVPGWLWFVALWCFGVGSAMSLGYAFKILMNLTLFAVK